MYAWNPIRYQCTGQGENSVKKPLGIVVSDAGLSSISCIAHLPDGCHIVEESAEELKGQMNKCSDSRHAFV
jgi:hypothetical protein